MEGRAFERRKVPELRPSGVKAHTFHRPYRESGLKPGPTRLALEGDAAYEFEAAGSGAFLVL